MTLQNRNGKLCHLNCNTLPTDQWYPVRIAKTDIMIDRFLDGEFKIPIVKAAIGKNMAYSLYHLEYIEECLVQQRLSSLLQVLNWKTGVITSVAFIEAVLMCLLRKNGFAKMEIWKRGKASEVLEEWNEGEISFRKIAFVAKKIVKNSPKEMKLQEMIDLAFKNNLLPEVFIKQDLENLRELRNRVHLIGKESDSKFDTDWWKFDLSTYDLAKKLVQHIIVIFFNPTEEEIKNYGFLLRKNITEENSKNTSSQDEF